MFTVNIFDSHFPFGNREIFLKKISTSNFVEMKRRMKLSNDKQNIESERK